MKFLIAGLGNMEPDYFNTRHNIGFDVVDKIADELKLNFKSSNLAHISETKYKGRQLLLIKPTTYMNLSGRAVKFWMEKENIPIEQVLIVLDDLNLELGSIRIRPGGADGGHNGLKDITMQLNTHKYARLRLGIGNNFSKGKQVHYVLGKWTTEETKKLNEIVSIASEACLSFCFSGLANTMNNFNSKKVE
ncbi:MAG: aminoacyl-tRNA hydrolase [Bacteroidota bacterium]|nr:aminoacyl-tRNA hydrolase [Bacteroidota bacterium]